MTDAELREKIASYPTWLYRFNLRGIETPSEDRHADRHPWRKRYFIDPLVKLMGGSLRGKRVLDLACNAGYWSLAAVEAGADFVQGIEAREMHVEQANLVFEASGIDRARYDFAVGNIHEVDFRRYGSFDVVLCLGIFYHVNKHMTLLERISEVCEDAVVIDTRTSLLPGTVLELRREPTDNPWHSADDELVMDPTPSAVIEMMRETGFDALTLRPTFEHETGIDGYRGGYRYAFLGTKKTPLDPLADLSVSGISPSPVRGKRPTPYRPG